LPGSSGQKSTRKVPVAWMARRIEAIGALQTRKQVGSQSMGNLINTRSCPPQAPGLMGKGPRDSHETFSD